MEMNRGFTLVELVVSIGIFVLMTSLIVAKFGKFNQSTLLTDTAYDVALTLRLAQTYGLSVRSASQLGSGSFQRSYGVDFSRNAGGDSCGASATSNITTLTLFADSPTVGTPSFCDTAGVDQAITSYLLIRGASLAKLCITPDGQAASQCQSDPVNEVSRLAVSFTRPDPEAVICASNGGAAPTCGYKYAEIVVQSSDGTARTIAVRQNGQISVQR